MSGQLLLTLALALASSSAGPLPGSLGGQGRLERAGARGSFLQGLGQQQEVTGRLGRSMGQRRGRRFLVREQAWRPEYPWRRHQGDPTVGTWRPVQRPAGTRASLPRSPMAVGPLVQSSGLLENWTSAILSFAHTHTAAFLAMNSLLLYAAIRAVGGARGRQAEGRAEDVEEVPEPLLLSMAEGSWLANLEERVMADAKLKRMDSFVCCLPAREEEQEVECFPQLPRTPARDMATLCSSELRYNVAFNMVETGRREAEGVP